MPNPNINRRLGSASGLILDAEVSDWVARVIANGGTVSTPTTMAANTFMLALKAANVRSKIYRLNFYGGTGLAACQTPLIKDQGLAYESLVSFVEADYSESTGLTGNGTTKWFSTGCQVSTISGISTAISYGLYVRTASNHSSLCMGTLSAGLNYTYLSVANSGNTYYSMDDNTAGLGPISDSNGNGFYLGVRNSGTDMKIYKNGAQLATTATPGSLNGSGPEIGVHAANQAGVGPFSFSNKSFGGYQISQGFDSTEQAALYNAWQAFQTALGRQV